MHIVLGNIPVEEEASSFYRQLNIAFWDGWVVFLEDDLYGDRFTHHEESINLEAGDTIHMLPGDVLTLHQLLEAGVSVQVWERIWEAGKEGVYTKLRLFTP